MKLRLAPAVAIVGLLSSFGGVKADTFSPPSVAGLTANPLTESGSGNKWRLYRVMDGFTTAPVEGSSGNHILMVKDSGGTFWKAPAAFLSVDGHPNYSTSSGAMSSRGPGGSAGTASFGNALSFTPGNSQLFSWKGALYCSSLDGTSGTYLTFGRLSHGEWTTLHEATVAPGTYFNLTAAKGLQSIPVKADEQLIMLVRSPYNSVNWAHLKYGTDQLKIESADDLNAVPQFLGAGGNPHTYSTAGEWSADYITEAHAGHDLNPDNHHPMIASSANWAGTSLKWGHPTFTTVYQRVLSSAGTGGGSGVDPLGRKSAISFRPYQSGRYRMTGDLTCFGLGGSLSQIKIGVFKKKSTAVTWLPLHDQQVADNGVLHLGSVPALRGFQLNAGDSLTVILSSPAGVVNWAQFGANPTNPVSVDRLPSDFNAWAGLPKAGGANPRADESGNLWGVYHITSAIASDVAAYSPMTWSATSQYWIGSPLTGDGHPTWKHTYGHLTASRAGDAGGVPAASFKPAKAGEYSWSGRLGIAYANGSSGGTVIFGKRTAANTFVTLHTQSFSRPATMPYLVNLDLEAIAQLQGIPVAAGDSLTVSLHPGYHASVVLFMNQTSVRAGDGSDRSLTRVTNPMPDNAGNEWTVAQVNTAGIPATSADFTPFTPLAAGQTWVGGILNPDGHPRWQPSTLALTASRNDTPVTPYKPPFGHGALIFKPASTGTYSWTGTVTVKSANGALNGSLNFGKLKANGDYQTISNQSVASSSNITTVNLGGIPAIQGIAVNANERLAVGFTAGYWSSLVAEFDHATNPVGLTGNGFSCLIPLPLAASPFGSLTATHVIDVNASGAPVNRRIFGLSEGHQPQPPSTANMFAPGMLVRGPGGTAEDTYWHWATHINSPTGQTRTILDFALLAQQVGFEPMAGIRITGCVPLMSGTYKYPHPDVYSLTPEQKAATYPLNNGQIAAIAKYAADYVRYTNYIMTHYTTATVNSMSPEDKLIYDSIDWGGRPKLVGPGDQPPSKIIYWEIGNESDLNIVATPSGAPLMNLREIYKAVTDAMCAVDNDIKVGPVWAYAGWSDSRMQDIAEDILGPNLKVPTSTSPNYRVDFFSFHPYGSLWSSFNSLKDAFDADPASQDFETKKKAAERHLRGFNGETLMDITMGFNAARKLVEEREKPRSPSDPQVHQDKVELIGGEHDPMGWIIWPEPHTPRNAYPFPYWPQSGMPAQYAVYSALGMVETFFTMNRLGYDGACFWDFEGGEQVHRPCWALYSKLKANMPDELVYQYAPDFNSADPKYDSVRIRATKSYDAPGKLLVWCSNLNHDTSASVRLGLRGISSTATVSKSYLWNPGNPAPNSADPLPGFLNYSLDTSHFVNWRSEPLGAAVDLNDFQLELYPATITLLEINL